MLAQQLINGVVVGSIYALFALGFTLMFGVMGVVNLLYGVYFSAGAFVALFLFQDWGVPLLAALPLSALGVGLFAVVLDGVLLSPLRRAHAPELSSLMVTLGATLVLYSIANGLLGSDIRRFGPALSQGSSFEFGGVRLSLIQASIILAVIFLVICLFTLLKRTKLGLAIRALSEDGDVALLMGVPVPRIIGAVSFLSGALGAGAGALIGLNYNAIQPYMGESMMLRGFAVIVLGGVGDVRGAVVAGLIVGLLETLTAGYIASSLKDAVGFALLVLTLWTRPTGLFGQSQVKRA